MDLVFHGLDGGQDSGKKNHAITEDGEESWEGTKGRYCRDHLAKFRCCSCLIVCVILFTNLIADYIYLCISQHVINKQLANDLIIKFVNILEYWWFLEFGCKFACVK